MTYLEFLTKYADFEFKMAKLKYELFKTNFTQV